MHITFYKLKCKCGQIYIGSTNNLKKRLKNHKFRYNKNNEYTARLYKHLRKCVTEFDEACCDIIQTIDCDNRTRSIIEYKFIMEFNTFLDGLNEHRTYNGLSRKDFNKTDIYTKTRRLSKYHCECGGVCALSVKARHFNSKKHSNYIEQHNS